SLLLGNILEWYEFCLFSFLEPYFEKSFFQGSSVAAWLGFAITFLARPFGGMALGLLGDLFGRKVSTFLSIFGMLLGTVGQGLVPSFQNGEALGYLGLILLILLRVIQGISTGGEIAAVPTYLTEVGAKKSLACCIVLIPATSQVGYFLAQLVSFAFEEALGEEAMTSWGWRLPFLLALLPGIPATLGRRCIPESEAYLGAQVEAPVQDARSAASSALSKMRELIRAYGPKLLLGFGAVAAVSVLQYGGMTWGLVTLKKSGVSGRVRIAAGASANALVILLGPVVGLFADRRGVAFIQLLGSLYLMVFGAPLLVAISTVQQPELIILLYGLGYGILGALFMVHMLQVVELFPVEVRNAGMGLSYNVGVCIFGGFAPMLSEASVLWFSWAPALLLAGGGLVTACATLTSLKMQSRGMMRLTHTRSEPYFRLCGKEPFAYPKEFDKSEPSPQKKDEAQQIPDDSEVQSVVALSADVGIGIRGLEGLQAFNVSDYGISQFRFLQYILLVHGRWCYRRIAILANYMFYKNFVCVLPQYFLGAVSGFSGQKLYNDILYQGYNVFFTFIPIMVFAVLDQDVPKKASLQYPELYRAGQQRLYMNYTVSLGWIASGVWHGLVVFFVPYMVMSNGNITHSDGKANDIWLVGSVVFFLVCLVTNLTVVLETCYLNWIVGLGLFLSLLAWIVFQGYISGLHGVVVTSEFYGSMQRLLGCPMIYLLVLTSTAMALMADIHTK
ncbi:ALA6, partial [Symbiodinium sp. KB8]